jgi:hypothetical protein
VIRDLISLPYAPGRPARRRGRSLRARLREIIDGLRQICTELAAPPSTTSVSAWPSAGTSKGPRRYEPGHLLKLVGADELEPSRRSQALPLPGPAEALTTSIAMREARRVEVELQAGAERVTLEVQDDDRVSSAREPAGAHPGWPLRPRRRPGRLARSGILQNQLRAGPRRICGSMPAVRDRSHLPDPAGIPPQSGTRVLGRAVLAGHDGFRTDRLSPGRCGRT